MNPVDPPDGVGGLLRPAGARDLARLDLASVRGRASDVARVREYLRCLTEALDDRIRIVEAERSRRRTGSTETTLAVAVAAILDAPTAAGPRGARPPLSADDLEHALARVHAVSPATSDPSLASDPELDEGIRALRTARRDAERESQRAERSMRRLRDELRRRGAGDA